MSESDDDILITPDAKATVIESIPESIPVIALTKTGRIKKPATASQLANLEKSRKVREAKCEAKRLEILEIKRVSKLEAKEELRLKNQALKDAEIIANVAKNYNKLNDSKSESSSEESASEDEGQEHWTQPVAIPPKKKYTFY